MLISGGERIDPFAEARGGIATFQRKLAHQDVGERVQQDVAQAGIRNAPDGDVAVITPHLMRQRELAVALADRFNICFPMRDQRFIEL